MSNKLVRLTILIQINACVSNFYPVEVVARGSETQLQLGKNLNCIPQHFKGSRRQ